MGKPSLFVPRERWQFEWMMPAMSPSAGSVSAVDLRRMRRVLGQSFGPSTLLLHQWVVDAFRATSDAPVVVAPPLIALDLGIALDVLQRALRRYSDFGHARVVVTDRCLRVQVPQHFAAVSDRRAEQLSIQRSVLVTQWAAMCAAHQAKEAE